MSDRICVIGNSHLAALKKGMELASAKTLSSEFTFYGAPGKTLNSFGVKDGYLVTDDPAALKAIRITNGKDSVLRLSDFDYFAIVGLRFSILLITSVYAAHRTCQHAYKAGAQYLVSDSCFNEAAFGALHGCLAVQLASKIRTATDTRIMICGQPMPSESFAQKFQWWRGLAKSGDSSELARIMENAGKSIPLKNVTYVPQPPDTKANPVLTLASYSTGSLRLTKDMATAHSADDGIHMNAHYGARVLEQLINVATTCNPDGLAASRGPD
jgi:hypothetical protein